MIVEQIINISVLAMILIMAILVVSTRDLLKSLIYLAVFSLLMAIEYLILAAPDVALTEAAVGACISTVLFLTVILSVGDKEAGKINFWYGIPVLIIYVIVVIMLADIPLFGSVEAAPNKYLVPYYINNTSADFGINNIVTAILAGYRSFDTLGELSVIFTAVIAVIAIITSIRKQKG